MLRRIIPFAYDLWKSRELLWQFSVRNVEMRHKGSHLGLIWTFLNPLLMLGLYTFVFGFIFDGKFGVLPHETRADYAIGIFFGLTLFQFVGEVMGIAPTIIVANPNFVKKVVFPLEILPAANVGAAGFHLMISLGLALSCLVLFDQAIHPELLWLPVIIAPLVLLCMGIAWLLSALGVFFRDIGQLMQFLTMALMYSSAVFFSATKIPAPFWMFLRFNPLLLAIELARNTSLWAQPMNYNHLLYLYGVGLFTCMIGHLAFKKMKPAFADVI
ncbi:MAG: ABC transporter permease [Cephaloticoccus sp.]|nr:ABC transporter permease [Cephaloticoccus sp.]MCF7760768.1 ABC transporter permease [Cephaloticoccus sp.]